MKSKSALKAMALAVLIVWSIATAILLFIGQGNEFINKFLEYNFILIAIYVVVIVSFIILSDK